MKITLGTVVSLKSNSLIHIANHHFLSLGGIEHFTTPLMVVIEVLYATQAELDEETGEEKIQQKGKNKYKCTYFSNKTMKFEENWFSENELKVYGASDHTVHLNVDSLSIKWGDTVRFKTVDEEARKTKSFNDGEKQKTGKPLLTFTSPALQVAGFSAIDKKESLIDPHNGQKKREKSEKLVKCKFFNTELDKFSEQLIPIECLQKIDITEIESHLEIISKFIISKSLVIIELQDAKYFGKPQSVHIFAGRYQLIFWNELLKKNEFIWMDLIVDFFEINLEDSKYYPGMHEVDGEHKVIDSPSFIKLNSEILKDSNIKIVYRNLKDQVISRYIQVKKVSNPVENEDPTISKQTYYLNAHCFYREAEREFRSDRILSIRTIEEVQLNTFLNSIYL
ncbi:hypothetical protein [Fluviicola taffensis]|uniref:WYL domain-containing protein n=1 Tax=Fluviicola taffensis (strain DSM 16823 / NCIMB 13979 / RW262) TaxID=755732 RepID=F2IGZ4_FLUTR|nr:hypothetical protein [Fluviicola taffensis]AEA44775.1 hypothetical protein Fluta_2795 [Fluviicola taffensis DSM 16823]